MLYVYTNITARFTICADGGANRFYDLMQKHGNESTTVRSLSRRPLDPKA